MISFQIYLQKDEEKKIAQLNGLVFMPFES